MNTYTTIDELKAQLSLGTTTAAVDTRLVGLLEDVSRWLDGELGRVFFARKEARVFAAGELDACQVDDLLAVTELATDENRDGTFATTWSPADYALSPANGFPKMCVRAVPWGVPRFPRRFASGVRITGTWGYGDGERAAPWDTVVSLSITCTDSATSIEATGLQAGQTILVEDEQMFVEAVVPLAGQTPASITVRRGVNGTTAAAHTGKPAAVAAYPRPIARACIYYAALWYGEAGREGLYMERTGDYSFTAFVPGKESELFNRLVGPYRRVAL